MHTSESPQSLPKLDAPSGQETELSRAAKCRLVCRLTYVTTPTVPPDPNLAPVLVVDDYPPLATVIAIALRRQLRREVVRVGSVQRALATTQPFELACLDLELPDGDSLELAEELLRRGVSRVVFFTACRDSERLAAAWNLGSVIDKTTGVDELVNVVRQTLREAEVVQLAVGSEGQPPSTPRRTNVSGTRRRIRSPKD